MFRIHSFDAADAALLEIRDCSRERPCPRHDRVAGFPLQRRGKHGSDARGSGPVCSVQAKSMSRDANYS